MVREIKMRDEKRIDRILGLIKELWEKSPDQRFGQLMINLGVFKDSLRVWVEEDYELESGLKKILHGEKKNE